MKRKKRIIGILLIFSICILIYSVLHLRYFSTNNVRVFSTLIQIFGVTIIYIPIIYIIGKVTKISILKDWRFPSIGMIFVLYVVAFLSIIINQPFSNLPSSLQNVLYGSTTLDIFIGGIRRTGLEIVYVAIVGPIFEEVLFRGVIQTYLLRKFSVQISIVLSSIIFALCHFTISGFLAISFGGIVFGIIYYKTKSLWCSIITHCFVNLSLSFLVNKTISNAHIYMYICALLILVVILKYLDKITLKQPVVH